MATSTLLLAESSRNQTNFRIVIVVNVEGGLQVDALALDPGGAGETFCGSLAGRNLHLDFIPVKCQLAAARPDFWRTFTFLLGAVRPVLSRRAQSRTTTTASRIKLHETPRTEKQASFRCIDQVSLRSQPKSTSIPLTSHGIVEPAAVVIPSSTCRSPSGLQARARRPAKLPRRRRLLLLVCLEEHHHPVRPLSRSDLRLAVLRLRRRLAVDCLETPEPSRQLRLSLEEQEPTAPRRRHHHHPAHRYLGEREQTHHQACSLVRPSQRPAVASSAVPRLRQPAEHLAHLHRLVVSSVHPRITHQQLLPARPPLVGCLASPLPPVHLKQLPL